MVRVAIVGAGYVGAIHGHAYRQIEQAQVVAIVDTEEKKGRPLANELNAQYVKSIDALLSDVDCDSVDICVPTYLHHPLVLKIAQTDHHIFCEKPLALTVEDANDMVKAVGRKSYKAMVGHVVRFGTEYQKIKEIIESGVLGKPLHAFCQRLASAPDWHFQNWGANEERSGGAALDLHIHDLDFLMWLFGKPTSVKAQGLNNPDIMKTGGFVHIDTCMQFDGGVVGFAEGGWAFGGAFPFTKIIRILCEGGTLENTFSSGKNIENRNMEKEIIIYMNDGSIDRIGVDSKDSFVTELKYFIDCIEKNREVAISTFEDGKNAVALALTAIKSAKENTNMEVIW